MLVGALALCAACSTHIAAIGSALRSLSEITHPEDVGLAAGVADAARRSFSLLGLISCSVCRAPRSSSNGRAAFFGLAGAVWSAKITCKPPVQVMPDAPNG